MHMADGFISPAAGCTMWAASAAMTMLCARKVRQEKEMRLVPLMGVLGAFIFACQMLNFTIPGTGSSGHLGGGLILAILLGPYAGFLVMAAILAVQALFFADGGLLALGCNIFNPAHIGRAILLASFPQQMTNWVLPATAAASDAVSTATPLAVMRATEKIWQAGGAASAAKLPDLMNLFWGNVGGSLGETCVPALVLGGLYLIYKKLIDWRIPVFYLVTVAILTGVYGAVMGYPSTFPLYHLFAGGLMIGAFFMATDWVTSPITKKGKIIYAIGLGVLTSLIRLRGSYTEGVCYSILMMNMVTPMIDRFVRNVSFGGGLKK